MQIPTYIISLPSSLTRREKIKKACEKEAALDAVFVDAVAGADLSYEIALARGYSREKRDRLYHDLELNEIACLLSHRKALDLFLATDASYCLILEDDAEFAPVFSTNLVSIVTQYKGWDLIKLDCREAQLRGFKVGDLGDAHTLYTPFNASHGTTAIVYAREGAQKVRSTMNDFIYAFDTHLGFAIYKHNISLAQVFPSLAKEARLEASTIGGRLANNKKKGMSNTLSRRLKRLSHSFQKRIHAYRSSILIKPAL